MAQIWIGADSKGTLSQHLAQRGAEVVAYDPDPALQSRLESLASQGLQPVSTLNAALAAGPYDLVVCRRVACLIDDPELTVLLTNLRRSVAPDGRVLFALCHPAYAPSSTTPEATPMESEQKDPDRVFAWEKIHRHSRRCLQEVHRPERLLRRVLGRAGLRIVARDERRSIDLERFEPIADLLMLELAPVDAPTVSLLIKACAMEAQTLDVQVRHLVNQLEYPQVFKEVVLALDVKADGFLRQYGRADREELLRSARTLLEQGWVDRIVDGPPPGEAAAALNARWFAPHGCRATHAANGAQLTSTIAGFEACSTRYVLHADVDVMIGRRERAHDYLQDMVAVLQGDPLAVTVAFNIARKRDVPYTAAGARGPWRTESRIGMLDLERLRGLLPLPNAMTDCALTLPWHRVLDRAVAEGRAASWRGGDRRTFFVHPPNVRKSDSHVWHQVLGRIERGEVPDCQFGVVDWLGAALDWLQPRRFEPFVFIIAGRDVPPSRFRRCIESVVRQRRDDWGAVVIDDASKPAWFEEIAHLCEPHSRRITLLQGRARQGLLANTVEAIRHQCGNPETVIITLDADDCLIGDRVLDEVAAHYVAGADVTVGSMLRTDKHRHYPVTFRRPRLHRGGNIWQHLRTFRKSLFDRIPDSALRLDGAYVELANDWAYMLPIVEMARRPHHIRTPLYLHEPGGPRDDDTRLKREAAIASIVARPSFGQDAAHSIEEEKLCPPMGATGADHASRSSAMHR